MSTYLRRMARSSFPAAAVLVALCLTGFQCDVRPLRILFLSKSSGFEHPVVRWVDGQPSVVDTALSQIADEMCATITVTKDASLINAEDLCSFDVVVFFTSGDLTLPGTDGQPPMTEQGLRDLLDWISGGGGFVGLHSASDTFHSDPDIGPSAYVDMLGGEFLRHGLQFEGTLVVTNPDHPVTQNVPAEWVLTEEWYVFTNFQGDVVQPLLLFDPGDEGTVQPMYDVDPYPLTWCRDYGDGRVFYTGLAHNEATWQDPTLRAMLRDAIRWCSH